MFEFLKKAKVYTSCNTDINYLEEKEQRLEDLKGMKERVILALCEINENIKYQYHDLINSLNTPFLPQNIQNYHEESQQHFKFLRELEQQFNKLLANAVDEMLATESGLSQYMKNVLNTENIKIKYCKNKYEEAANIIFLNRGQDIDICQMQIEAALLKFYASKEYVEVLQRYRTESLKR